MRSLNKYIFICSALIVSGIVFCFVFFSEPEPTFISVIEMVPADKSYPIKVVVYVEPSYNLRNLRELENLRKIDFQVNSSLPKVAEYGKAKISAGVLGKVSVKIGSDGNIRVEW